MKIILGVSVVRHTLGLTTNHADLKVVEKNRALSDVEIRDIPSRKISEATCRKFGYGYGMYRGKERKLHNTEMQTV